MANDTYTVPSATPGLNFVYDKATDDPVGVTTPDGKEVKFGGAGSAPAAVVSAVGMLNPAPYALMASPPTVTSSQINPLAAGKLWSSLTAGGQPNTGRFGMFCGAYFRQQGTGWPDLNFVVADSFTQGSPSPFASNALQYSFLHKGSKFAIFMKGVGTNFRVRVDDKYVSLIHASLPSDGGLYYIQYDFGTVGTRRIDLIGSAIIFGGIYTDLADKVIAAEMRGIPTVVFSDSFGEGTGNEVTGLDSYIRHIAEYLSFDHVINSSVGGTGLIAGGSPRAPFGARIARDLAGVPGIQLALIQLSINDGGHPASNVVAAAQALVDTATSAGYAGKWGWISPTINTGAGKIGSLQREQNAAMRSWAAARGDIYINDMEMPFLPGSTPRQTTSTSAVSAGLSSSFTSSQPLIMGSTYKFSDGTFFAAKSVAGNTVTADYVRNPQLPGAVITQVGNCYLTGTGSLVNPSDWGNCDLAVGRLLGGDGTHPSAYGHMLKGRVDATLFIRALGGA